MKLKVISEQNIGRGCFVCGRENAIGLHERFFELEDGSVACKVCFDEKYQSYPGRVHGGIVGTLLDELCARALHPIEPEIWAVTGEMTVKYHHPTPVGVDLTARVTVEKNGHMMFVPKAELRDQTGTLLVSATGKYVKLTGNRITEVPLEGAEWMPSDGKNTPEFIEWGGK